MKKLSRSRAGLPGHVDVPKVYVDVPKVQEFDLLCAAPGIQHSLAPPQHPQTNGMAECFNGRIKDVPQSHHFRSGEEMETTLHRSVVLSTSSCRNRPWAAGPPQAMKEWHNLKPELFRRQPNHLPGCDS
jgi:transposase InsO family protein